MLNRNLTDKIEDNFNLLELTIYSQVVERNTLVLESF
jgi:hypothetical protein